jgi:hypothetical protein
MIMVMQGFLVPVVVVSCTKISIQSVPNGQQMSISSGSLFHQLSASGILIYWKAGPIFLKCCFHLILVDSELFN